MDDAVAAEGLLTLDSEPASSEPHDDGGHVPLSPRFLSRADLKALRGVKSFSAKNFDSNNEVDATAAPAFGSGQSFQKREDSERLTQLQRAGSCSTHTVSETEVEAFAGFLNDSLSEESFVSDLLPLPRDDPDAFVNCFRDGRLLTALVNLVQPGTVDLDTVGFKDHLTRSYELNHKSLEGCSRIDGIKLTNVSAADFVEGRPTLVLGVVWQLIFARTLDLVSLRHHPEVTRLLREGESLESFCDLPREQILVRWFNYQLEAAQSERRVSNLGSDLRDGRAYEDLLRQLDADNSCGVAGILAGDGSGGIGGESGETAGIFGTTVGIARLKGRAARVIAAAKALGVEQVPLLPSDIARGSSRLNTLFVAQIFHAAPRLLPLTSAEEAVLLSLGVAKLTAAIRFQQRERERRRRQREAEAALQLGKDEAALGNLLNAAESFDDGAQLGVNVKRRDGLQLIREDSADEYDEPTGRLWFLCCGLGRFNG